MVLLSLCWQRQPLERKEGQAHLTGLGVGVGEGRIHLDRPSPTSAPGTCSPCPRGANPGPSHLTCQILTVRWLEVLQRAARDNARRPERGPDPRQQAVYARAPGPPGPGPPPGRAHRRAGPTAGPGPPPLLPGPPASPTGNRLRRAAPPQFLLASASPSASLTRPP